MKTNNPLSLSRDDLQHVIDKISSDAFPVGIDPVYTHALILEYLQTIDRKLSAIEQSLSPNEKTETGNETMESARAKLSMENENDFWNKAWENDMTGFHQRKVNNILERYYPQIGWKEGQRIFVPLCGKSLDMLWLAEKGHNVVGVELSRIAVRAFLEENDLRWQAVEQPPFEVWSIGQNLEVMLGDLFIMKPRDLGDVDGLYDRAALIALLPETRKLYATKLAELLPSGTKMFLVTIEYNQEEMLGPPFSVTEKEVRELFSPDFEIECLHEEDALSRSRFPLTALTQKAFLLTRR